MARARSASLSTSDLRRVLEVAERLAPVSHLTDESEFHTHVASAVAHLLDGPWTASERFSFDAALARRGTVERARAGFVTWECGTVVSEVNADMYQTFKQHVSEHAYLAEAHERSGAGVISRDAYRRAGTRFTHLGLYQDFYKKLEISEQLSLVVDPTGSNAWLITCSRDAPYTGRDIKMLDLILPHVRACSVNFNKLAASGNGRLPSTEALMERFDLPPRRAEVLHHLARGPTNPQIAAELGPSVGTVRKHVELVLHDLDVSNRTAAAARVQSPPS